VVASVTVELLESFWVVTPEIWPGVLRAKVTMRPDG
jgi:hypothetical protein